MRLVLQRVKRARVLVRGERRAEIGTGVMLLAGFSREATSGLPQSPEWGKLVGKVPELRIFPDEGGRSNLSLRDVGGEILAVPQFTLFADCRRGRRPSFTGAAEPATAEMLFRELVREMEGMCPGRVAQGSFGEEMDLDFVNWGPVTICLDRRDFV
jgi:D-tyrosyl-tRNA(Tyr) deacylase